MLRYARLVFACLLAAIAATPASAMVIATGSFGADESVFDSYAVDYGPGRYRFTLTLSVPVLANSSFVQKLTVTNFFCMDPDVGPDEFACGGNDVPTDYAFQAVTPLTSRALVDVAPLASVPFGSPPIVRYEEFDTCCDITIDLATAAAGTYTLSAVAVPEPASWVLLIVGIGAVGGRLRRRTDAPLPA